MRRNIKSVIAVITTSLMFSATVFAVPETVLGKEDLIVDGNVPVEEDMSDLTLSEDDEGLQMDISEEESADVLEADSSSFTDPSAISVNREYSDRVTSEADDNYYKFTLTSAGYVSFDFTHDLFGDDYDWWVLGLYDPKAGREDPLLEYRYHANENAITHSTGTGLPAGDYILSIDAKEACVSKTFKFKVNFTASSVYETEVNDDAARADAISVNSQYSGTIRRTESVNFWDKDYYRFSLAKPGCVDITFSHGYVDEDENFWKIELFDEKNTETPHLTRRASGNERNKKTFNGTGLPAGNYYLVISQNGPYWSGEVYNFTVNFTSSANCETEPNDTAACADPIKTDVKYSGNIMEKEDEDLYLFSLDKKSDVTFTFSHPYVNEEDTWEVSLCNFNDPERVLTSKKFLGTDTAPVTSGKVSLSSGRYLVKVTRCPSVWSDVRYQICVNSGQLSATTKLTAVNTAKGIRLSYKKVAGATKYIIYRNDKKIATVNGNSNVTYTDKDTLTNGKKYTYKVFAANTSGKSAKSKSVVICRLKRGELSSVKTSGKKAVRVKWKKNSKASGYEIQYAKDSGFTSGKKTVKIKGADTTGKKIKDLKSKKKYYFRVRSYKTVSGTKYYSCWSTTVSRKTE